ncbi:prepilin-type N-terminal cleavage/methylation domain-containing protein [Candidatus Dojkabacteria bacterium]|nr:prepilin-type N-terminal cleavage/methylation domain-containing protein [Candidatus Dojkabacteria bacterium]
MENITKNSIIIKLSSILFHVPCYVLYENSQLSHVIIRLTQYKKRAFTLLELLLVIAIIAVLAGLVVFNLRPADVLRNANDTKNVANSKDIKKALEAYALDHDGNLPTSLQGQLSGEYTICKQSEVSCPVGSISLDELITAGYLSTIPVNENLAGEKTTGYAIEYDATKGTVEIIPGETTSQIVSAGSYTFTTSSVLGSATTYENYDITVNSGVTVTMWGSHTFASVTVENGGIIDVGQWGESNNTAKGKLMITANTINIKNGGVVNAYGRGYGGGAGGAGNMAGDGGSASGYTNPNGTSGILGGTPSSGGLGGGFGGGGGGNSQEWNTIGIGSGNGGNGGNDSGRAQYESGGGGGGGSGDGVCTASSGNDGIFAGTGGNGGLGCNGGGIGGKGGDMYSWCKGSGGGGGGGGGSFGGAGGGGANGAVEGGNGSNGLKGGYMGTAINGDISTSFPLDTSDSSDISMGSGGGGGGSGAWHCVIPCAYGQPGDGGHGGVEGLTHLSCGGMGSGGGGSAGGGIVIISANNSLTVAGSIIADGAGKAQLNAGFGAGGGIALKAPTINLTGATIRSLGGNMTGNGVTTNGGTIKVFTNTYIGSTLNTTSFPAGRVYSQSYIQATSTPSPTPQIWDATSGLIAYWPLSEASGTTTDDASISSYSGTLVNMDPATDWVAGKFGNALDFDGVNDWVDFPNGFADFTGGISIGFWIYPTTTGYWSRFVELGNGCLNSGTILVSRYGTSNSIAYQSRGTGNQVLADEVLTLNEWQHFVITQDASANVKIYKNSLNQTTSGSASLPTNVTRSSNWLSESGCGHGYDSYFAGKLDDIRVYNKALSEQEVGYLYVLVP